MKTMTSSRKGHLILLAVFLLITAVLNTSGQAQDELNFKPYWQITYDGYLWQVKDSNRHVVQADTLITVNNPGTTPMALWIRVYDKHGDLVKLVSKGMLHNSNGYILTAPPKGFLWVTLGMIVPESTIDPFGISPSGQKFQFTIFSGPDPSALKPYRPAKPIVEVKQVIYNEFLENPEKAIWNPAYIKTWAETSLTVPERRSTVVIPIK